MLFGLVLPHACLMVIIEGWTELFQSAPLLQFHKANYPYIHFPWVSFLYDYMVPLSKISSSNPHDRGAPAGPLSAFEKHFSVYPSENLDSSECTGIFEAEILSHAPLLLVLKVRIGRLEILFVTSPFS